MDDPAAFIRAVRPILQDLFTASIGTAVILLLCVAASDLGRWLWN